MGVLALFLTGAMSVQIGRDFNINPASIGALASVFAIATSLGSAPLGRQVRRLGIRRSLWVATGASCTALVICSASRSVAMLAGGLLVGGLGNAIGQPAGNALVAAQVRPSRYGLGFGIKQSGIPLATMLGGLAVPLIALTVGWRFAYVLAAAGRARGGVARPGGPSRNSRPQRAAGSTGTTEVVVAAGRRDDRCCAGRDLHRCPGGSGWG